MSDLVDPTQIERIVGATRHPTSHIGRAVAAEETLFVMHSSACRAEYADLRRCPYSLAIDRGIILSEWDAWEDRPVTLAIRSGRLVPTQEWNR